MVAWLLVQSFSTVIAEIDEGSLVRVERGNLARSVVATGVVEPISNRVELRSRASGIVEQLYRDVGDGVRSGEALIELDREQLLAQLRAAKANLAAATADVRAAQAELERYRIRAEDYDVRLARRNHARGRELHDAGLIAKSEYDITEGALDEAVNRQRAALSAIGSAEAAIAQKEAKVLQLQAVIDRIAEELRYTTIRSPIDGVVLSREVEVGSAVSSITTMGAGAVEGLLDTLIYRPVSLEGWQAAQRQVRSTLGRIHGFDPRDESALGMWDTVQTAEFTDAIFTSMEIFLGAVALITLSLGGVGVANTMLMTVSERTSEIGLKKALGATRLRIMGEFFMEGMVLAMLAGVGGICGVVLLAAVVNMLPMPGMFAGLIIDARVGLIVAAALGVVAICAAMPPAWRAAQLTPIEALRYER